jgi:hypothetical protein
MITVFRDSLDKHPYENTRNGRMFKDVHYVRRSVISVFPKPRKNHALGTMGSRAPFHSQRQKIATTTNADSNGARTNGDVHGKVTPPCK